MSFRDKHSTRRSRSPIPYNMPFSRILRIVGLSISRLPNEIAYAKWAASTMSKMQIVDEVKLVLQQLPPFVYPSASAALFVVTAPSSSPSPSLSSLYPRLLFQTLPSTIPRHSHTKTHKRKPPPSILSLQPTNKPRSSHLEPYEEEAACFLAKAFTQSAREADLAKQVEQCEQEELATAICLSLDSDIDDLQDRMDSTLATTEDMYIMQASADDDDGLADVGEATSRELLDQLANTSANEVNLFHPIVLSSTLFQWPSSALDLKPLSGINQFL